MKRIVILFLFHFMFTAFGKAQALDSLSTNRKEITIEKQFSLLIGYNGWKYSFAEIGFALNHFQTRGIQAAGYSLSISDEIKIGDKLIMGPKIGAWIGGGIAIGLNLVYYTDFTDGTLRFRPEIGGGFDRFKIVYGYNLALSNRDFRGINTNNIGIVYLVNLKKLKTTIR